MQRLLITSLLLAYSNASLAQPTPYDGVKFSPEDYLLNTNIDTEPEFEDEDNLITLTSLETPQLADDTIPYEALRTFVEVFDNIKKNYVEETSNAELIENAIRGMISRLDPHSSFMNDDELQAFQEQTDGEYAGIGVVLDFQNGAIEVISAIAGSPADKAGIKSGDIFTTINQQSVQDMALQDAVTLLEGQPGTEVKLGILRDDEIINLSLLRDTIQTDSVTTRWLAPGIAAVQISQFQENTANSLEEKVAALQSEEPIKGIVLDLRNNPGGYLFSAVDSADQFLDKGRILSVRDRDNMEQQLYSAHEGDILSGAPIVVLVNRGTASSAEILAAALQENFRALIAGQQTFGKGSVQTVIPLYNGGAVKLTTAKYYTPTGQFIQARGITPDIKLTKLNISDLIPNDQSESEASLYRHLKNTQDIDDESKSDHDRTSLASSDFVLYEALNILKTMVLTVNNPLSSH